MATAKDVMTEQFYTLAPDISIGEAVKMFKTAGRETGQNVFGMMVTDKNGRLVGMLSMYDILLFIRPKHIHIWGVMDDIDIDTLMANACERARSIRVGDIMTTDVVTVAPDTHLMMVLEIMVKRHIRRIPVLENEKAVGIVYISSFFYHLFDRLTT